MDIGDKVTVALTSVGTANVGKYGTLTLSEDGAYSYVITDESLATGFKGTETFNYTVTDKFGGTNTSTLTINVEGLNDAPVAEDMSETTSENTSLTKAFAADDVDSDDDQATLAYSIVAGPGAGKGTVTINGDGTFTFDPGTDFDHLAQGAKETVTFTYKAFDGTDSSETKTVSIEVTGVNDGPTVSGPVAIEAVAEDSGIRTITQAELLANAHDMDNATDLRAMDLVISAGNGSLKDNGDGTWDYTPALNDDTFVTFSFKVTDGVQGTVPVATSATLDITSVNDAPVGRVDAYETSEDTALIVSAGGVLGNDTDVDSSTLTVELVSGPAHGTLELNPDGTFTYTPAANYNGTDFFTYKASDGSLTSEVTTVSLDVMAVNDIPVAEVGQAEEDEDTQISGSVNATDVDGDSLTYSIVGDKPAGLTFNSNGSFTYQGAQDSNGEVAFQFRAFDGTAYSNAETFTINVKPVNDAPVATVDSYSVGEDGTLTVTADQGILVNDGDVDSSTLTSVLVSGPANGSLTLNADGSFAYKPAANYNGSDSFTYKVNDGSVDGNTVTVSLTVNAVDDAPVAVNDTAAVDEDASVKIDVVANDTDIDGGDKMVVSVGNAANGVAAINTDGTITYTPTADFNGTDSFTYTLNGGATATVQVTVAAVNDAPTGTDSTVSTNEDIAYTFKMADFGFQDIDTGDSLSAVRIDTLPGVGTLMLSGQAVGQGQVISASDIANLTFTPTADANGLSYTSFTFSVRDGVNAFDTSPNKITIDVKPVNDTPVANAQNLTTNEETSKAITLTGFDVDGDGLTYTIVSGPSNGTLSGTGTNLTYTPSLNYNGQDSFVFQVDDEHGGTSTATVSLMVAAVNDAPVIAGDLKADIFEGGPYLINVGDLGESDPDDSGTDLTYIVSAQTNGKVLVSGQAATSFTAQDVVDGKVSFLHDGSETTSASFSFSLKDGGEDGAQAVNGTFDFQVDPVNDNPIAITESVTTDEDHSVTFNALANDSDPEQDPLSILSAVIVDSNGNVITNKGTVTISGGSLTFNPGQAFQSLNTEQSEVVNIKYTISDGHGGTATVIDQVNVAGVTDGGSFETWPGSWLMAGSVSQDSTLKSEGSFSAKLVTGGDTAQNIATFLNTTLDMLAGINNVTRQSLQNGSAIKTASTVHLDQGDILSFDYLFQTTEGSGSGQYRNDFSLVLIGANGQEIIDANAISSAPNGSTFTEKNIQINQTGNYTIAFAVLNIGDQSDQSTLWIDDLKIINSAASGGGTDWII